MSEFIVEMKHIDKEFPGVKALDDVSFNLRSSEVMALVGENGAGKSTLVKILSGIYSRDGGSVRLFDEEIEGLTPKLAKEKGVAIIHQELNMCRHLSVAENIFLGREICKHAKVLDSAKMENESAKVLGKLGVDISPSTIVADLPVSKQQMVEIAKALSIDARILIMDEPTSALTSKETDELFKIIRQLRNNGCGIIYISHRLEELKHVCDRITIMRDGKFIVEKNFSDISMDSIISHMVGRKIEEKYPRVAQVPGKTILEVKKLKAGKMVRDVNFSVRVGEIVGIAGLMGSGRTETTRAIFGVDTKDSGEIYLEGKQIDINKPKDAIKHGIMLAPEDRKKDGLCVKLSVRENIALPNLDLLRYRNGVINRKKEKKLVDSSVNDLLIKVADTETNVINLSGGNQQKVVVAKCVARNSKIIIFDEPTRGIDVAAKVEIYNLMNHLKSQGIGVLFISSEMPEVIGIADRILVMCDGKITGELSREEATQEKILTLATRFEAKLGQEEDV